MTIKHITVLGLGKVGKLVALLLSQTPFNVTGIDAREFTSPHFTTISGDIGNIRFIKKHLATSDAVVSCLPYHLNKGVAQAAFDLGIHYFDLTEDVGSTEFIYKLAKKSKGVMAPQCGLAPGFIAIVGASLAKHFKKTRSIKLRVGALPQHPTGDLGYAFNWSPEGVVNEYLNDCIAIKEGSIKKIPAMQELETIVIGGKTLEAFTTSGGLGSMCESFADKVEELNYKTMRYPGHMKLMRFYFHELLMKENRELAGEILVHAKPPVNEDVVYIHASVEGWKTAQNIKNNELYREEFVRTYYPKIIAGESWRAISWTTACSIAAVVEMVASKKLPAKGFIKQENIQLEDFLQSTHGSLYTVQE